MKKKKRKERRRGGEREKKDKSKASFKLFQVFYKQSNVFVPNDTQPSQLKAVDNTECISAEE